jgi:excisionase family DNA binding protein
MIGESPDPSPAGSTPNWATVRQLAQHLHLGVHHAYRLLGRGALPSHRIGRKVLVDLNEIDRIVKAGTLLRVPPS